MNPIDDLHLDVWRHRLSGVAEEMGETLRRTGFSPNIKERLDYSCAVFNPAGEMVAQAAHIPAHLGAMPASVQTVLPLFDDWRDGDLVMVNDPFKGGNHLPDITMVSPVCTGPADRPDFFVASRAHHADVGGMSPGSMPLSTEIHQEGIIIPPVRLYRQGHLNRDLQALVLRNVRTPEERRGDINAQAAAHRVGTRRLVALCDRHGLEEVRRSTGLLMDRSEAAVRAAIRSWPDGRWMFEDVLEWNGADNERGETELIKLKVALAVRDDNLHLDFSGTAPTFAGSLNAVIAITMSASYYAVLCLLEEGTAVNSGCFRPFRFTAPPGTVVNALPPSAVAGGNVETSQRIVDLVLGAFAQAMPDRLPAASQGTMNNLTVGGTLADGTPWSYYETMAGGMGGGPDRPGLDAVHVHMTNTRNTPVEAIELTWPVQVETCAVRRGSGGPGRFAGGHGIVRAYRLLRECTATMLSERRARPPWGLGGGQPGATGHNELQRADGQTVRLPGKFSVRCRPGDVLRIATPGGGGWGTPREPSEPQS